MHILNTVFYKFPKVPTKLKPRAFFKWQSFLILAVKRLINEKIPSVLLFPQILPRFPQFIF